MSALLPMSHRKTACPAGQDDHMKRKRSWAFLTVIAATLEALRLKQVRS